ncbi:MAG: nuclear transport factor 2 family protein [Planctomycetota bacterium]
MAKKAAAKRTSAKKVTKKASKKVAKRSTSKKTAIKKKTTKKTTKKAGPRKVGTGKGLSAAELGTILVDHVNKGGDDLELWKKYFSTKCVSIEGSGEAHDGRKAMKAKYDWFFSNFEVHSCKAVGPFVGATGFSVHFIVDMTDKASGHRHEGPEIGVYTVKNGKIVQEEFMYGPMPSAS